MTRRARVNLRTAALLLFLLPSAARAYTDDELRAILLARPDTLPRQTGRLVLAHQMQLTVRSAGGLSSEDHILEVIGPNLPPGSLQYRWTYRVGIDNMGEMVARIHRRSATVETIPPESIRAEPCGAGGAQGYPGLADMVIAVPKPTPGDVVEIKVVGVETGLFASNAECGEYNFAAGDSVVETELRILFPAASPLLIWRLGGLAPPREITHAGLYEARWLLGHLGPAAPLARTTTNLLTIQAPDTAGPPAVLFGHRMSWEEVVAARRSFWEKALSKNPEELVTASREILAGHPDPGERLEAAIAWVDQRLARLEIPATRLWFIPTSLQLVLDRGAAIPRDRAAVLVWLLRQLGLPADAALVRSRPGCLEDLAFPQQFDTWLVRAVAHPGEERWIDLRSVRAEADPLPRGPALLWTAREDQPVLVRFPGIGG